MQVMHFLSALGAGVKAGSPHYVSQFLDAADAGAPETGAGMQSIGLVGYGEVGRIFAAGLRPQVAQVAAEDPEIAAKNIPASTETMACAGHHASLCSSNSRQYVRGANIKKSEGR
mgnify:CR=1 FL=1